MLLAAGLAATGMQWLIRTHPSLGEKPTVEHLLLPTLTTFIIGVPLALLPSGVPWWISFGISASLLTAVFLAEYVSVDPTAPYYAFARAGLTALSYALFLILVTALRFSVVRMFILIPAVFITAGLISLRILHLDGTDRWDFPWAIGIGLICAQISAGLHYWPLSPISFGLAVLGPAYALTSLIAGLVQGESLSRAILEPGGSRPAAELVREFLGRPHAFDAFAAWLDAEVAA